MAFARRRQSLIVRAFLISSGSLHGHVGIMRCRPAGDPPARVCSCYSNKPADILQYMALHDALASSIFYHYGTARQSDVYVYETLNVSYIEPDNVTCVNCRWATPGFRYPDRWQHLFQRLGDGTLVAPPIGLRSSPPLGGLGAGSVELRADGSFRQWTIWNQGPAGSGKYVDGTRTGVHPLSPSSVLNGAHQLTHAWVRASPARLQVWPVRRVADSHLPRDHLGDRHHRHGHRPRQRR